MILAQRNDAFAHRHEHWADCVNNILLGRVNFAGPQHLDGRLQGSQHELLAVLAELLDELLVFVAHGNGRVGVPDLADLGDVAVDIGGLLADNLGRRCHQRHGDGEAVAQQQPVDTGDLGARHHGVVVHLIEMFVGITHADDAHDADGDEQHADDAKRDNETHFDGQITHMHFLCFRSAPG